jgi:hypothetical protein
MFRALYDSIYHHPLAMWAVGAVVLVALLAKNAPKRGLLGALLLVFQLEIMLDAWLTGALSPLTPHTTLATAAAVLFVILGDLRFFVLLERFTHPRGAHLTRWLLAPVAYALWIPIVSNVASVVWPGNLRAQFLTYEMMFAALAIVIRVRILPRRTEVAPEHHAFGVKLTHFEIVQYALWASADVVILLGHDVGYLLRLVPNMMYYAAFVPFAWHSAPAEVAP